MNKSAKTCFLFDNDGTLVDSERLCNIGIVLMFRRMGIELDADELVSTYRGWKLDRTLSTLESIYEVTLHNEFIPEYRLIVAELFDRELKPVEGVIEALEAIDSPKAVVSSGPMKKIKQALEVCGISRYFGDNIYSSYEVGIWKPDPGIYLHAALDMGFEPESCVVIDDSPVGVQAGAYAGMKTLFFNRFNEACRISGVTSISSMTELLALTSGGNRK